MRTTISIRALALAGMAVAPIWATPALAMSDAVRGTMIDIPAQDLGSALVYLGRQTGQEVVFAPQLVAGKRASPVRGRMSGEEAVRRLLRGTGLAARATTQGGLVIEASPARLSARPASAFSLQDMPQGSDNMPPAAEPAVADAPQEDIVVTGIRASLSSAQARKRDAAQIVDSIVAQDIGKLPDVNVAEALQRITGVQISRNQGEGSGIAIRGLTQVRTELDGRSIFTSGGRTLSFEDVPSELLAGADVYKSPTADQIEGGIGGLVNLRLRKPLDFDGFEAAAQARATYYDFADRAAPQVSALISNRWDTGIGEIGVLLSGAYQHTNFRSDFNAVEPFNLRRDLVDLNGNGVPGEEADAIFAPGGGGVRSEQGTRDRYGANLAIQWRPSDSLELYVDGLYSLYEIGSNTSLFYALGNSADPDDMQAGGDFTVVEGTNSFQSGTWRNVRLQQSTYTDRRESQTWQLAGGFRWERDAVKWRTDLSYTDARTDTAYRSLSFRGFTPTLTQDLSGGFASLETGGIDLTDPARFTYDNASEYISSNSGSEVAVQSDAEFEIDGGFLKKVKIGVRYADRGAVDGNVYVFNDLTDFPASFYPGGVGTADLDLFRRGTYRDRVNVPQRFLAPPLGAVEDFQQVRDAFGLPSGEPQLSPLTQFDLSERTGALYITGDYGFDVGTVRITGNAGVRVIRTQVSTTGFQVAEGGGFAPLSVGGTYVSALPNFNIRADLTDRLTLRGAASRGLTRPNFTDLSPSLAVDYLFLTGSAGNPALGPLTADQFDISLEYYLSRTSLIYAAGFMKNVDGFITNVIGNEVINGQVFEIRRPQNGESGEIRGFELGWNQFLDFLPGPLDGLGFQANYTYVDSEAPGPLAGQTVPLEGLSRHSFNLIGLYEKGPLSMRVAYNWRDAFVATTAGPGSGSNPIYNDGGGVLDASVNFDVTDNLSVTIDGANLTRTPTVTYFGETFRPRENSVTDRRISAGIRARF
ncbi:TonB-dependent receptor [Sphingomonas sp.]|uniref:TonB-dependent receptor n=1 Tax=Sphingomonas sp. TaxID=28214 RepID=UPI002C3E4B84|nr:TonB-dependent receptor [Sphingomonas sp.]HTG37381.1 TonB-dependent receptor [Sphingomonas sp.]